MSDWSVYFIQTRLNTLYAGISTDVERRLREHASSKKGARYLKGKGPLRLMWQQEVGSKGAALRLEYQLKQLTRTQKNSLISGQVPLQQLVDLEEIKRAANQIKNDGMEM